MLPRHAEARRAVVLDSEIDREGERPGRMAGADVARDRRKPSVCEVRTGLGQMATARPSAACGVAVARGDGDEAGDGLVAGVPPTPPLGGREEVRGAAGQRRTSAIAAAAIRAAAGVIEGLLCGSQIRAPPLSAWFGSSTAIARRVASGRSVGPSSSHAARIVSGLARACRLPDLSASTRSAASDLEASGWRSGAST